MSDEFFDTNIILYLLDNSEKTIIAEKLLAKGGKISVQVMNEVLVNCRRKANMNWQESGQFLSGIRKLCKVAPLTIRTHEIGAALGERYGFSVYDAMIVS